MDPQATPPISTSPVAPTPTKSNLPMILIGLVILLLVGGGGIFLARQLSKPVVTPTPIEVQPTITADPTANWQTFSDAGITVKYPTDFQVNPPEFAGAQDDVTLAKDVSFPESPNSHLKTRYIFEARVRFQESTPTASTCYRSSDSKTPFTKNKTINGIVFYYGEPTTEGAAGTHVITKEYTALDGNGFCYQIDLTHLASSDWNDLQDNKMEAADEIKGFALLEQIFSTFKFNSTTSLVTLTSPSQNQVVTSPLTVSGTVPAGWMFEGQLPLKLLDADRKVIAQGTGKEVTPGSWQSGQPVKFTGTITFTTTAKSGFLVITNDNPSGLPENAKSYEMSVYYNCRPRPACLDSNPRCMIAETEDMCPKSP